MVPGARTGASSGDVAEAGSGVIVCVPAGGAFATDASDTMTLLAGAFLAGKGGGKPGGLAGVAPLAAEGRRGGAPCGSGALSAIVLSAWVDAENRDRNARRLACSQQIARRIDAIDRFRKGQTHHAAGRRGTKGKLFGVKGTVWHEDSQPFYRIYRGFALH